ncbi:MAG: DUF4861 family protein [Bacteroidales bacterium]|nr:DUF4861 family protein [Bacteroidales bacterium]
MKRSGSLLYICMLAASLFSGITASFAQTACSLSCKGGEQTGEVSSADSILSGELGHGGPAVENQYMALRLLCDGSGAIDVYSKSGRGLELSKYGWYTDSLAIADYGAGHDDYVVDGTIGLGGVALWDDGRIVRLMPTSGQKARAGNTAKGSFAEVVSYGVEYGGGKVDILVRVDVSAKIRTAWVTARCLNGKKVSFVTGLNYHEGMAVECGNGYIYTWGRHPDALVPVGAGLFYSKSVFAGPEKDGGMAVIVSKPGQQVSYRVVAASTREAELNSQKRFAVFMTK